MPLRLLLEWVREWMSNRAHANKKKKEYTHSIFFSSFTFFQNTEWNKWTTSNLNGREWKSKEIITTWTSYSRTHTIFSVPRPNITTIIIIKSIMKYHGLGSSSFILYANFYTGHFCRLHHRRHCHHHCPLDFFHRIPFKVHSTANK